MKKISLLLLAVFFHPGAFAQSVVDYDQDLYVFQTSAMPISSEQEYLELVDACNDLIAGTGLGDSVFIDPYTTDIAVKSMLQSIHTKKTNGSLKKPIKNIGEMLVCQDWTGVTAENNFIPAFYDVTIDGKNFIAEGGGFSPVFNQLPGGGQIMAPNNDGIYYPAEGVFLVNYDFTILPSLPLGELGDGTGGSMSINSIVNFAGNPQFQSGGLGIIRFFNPITE